MNIQNDKYLGTIAGDQKNLDGTYARVYHGFSTCNQLRESLNGINYKKIGLEYSYTPPHLRDGRNFGTKRTSTQGGKFFRTAKRVPKEMSSEDYALSVLGLSDKHLRKCQAYGISYIVHKYFEKIKTPQDGDLVVYGKKHAGIFRDSKPNWNSPRGGTVESKWSHFTSPDVFQHDVFLVPAAFGDVAKFYRQRKEKLPAKSLPSPSETMYEVKDGSYVFNPSDDNIKRRDDIDRTKAYELAKKYPQIQLLDYIQCPLGTLCFHYALGKYLKTYVNNTEVIEGYFQPLDQYFTATKDPKKGDLAVYYDKYDGPTHFGIYLSENCIESKWGHDAVFRHAPFYVSQSYGDRIEFFRKKPGLTIEELRQKMSRL